MDRDFVLFIVLFFNYVVYFILLRAPMRDCFI